MAESLNRMSATKPLLKVASVVVSAIPARYRTKWLVARDEDLRGPAIVSGMLEFLLGAPGTLLYIATALDTAKAGLGIAGLVLNPFLPSVFLFIEGGIRLLAALGSGEILPTLPLALIAWLQDKKEGKAHLLSLGPLVPDVVERADGQPWAVRVLSCRPKLHWNSYNTIRYEGEFYQLMQQDLTTGQRKFVYLLRKNPATRLVVVVYEYDPKDVLSPDSVPRRWHCLSK